MQFRKLPNWVHNALHLAMQRADIRSSLNLCISEDKALILHLANKPDRPDRTVVAQYTVASVQEAYDRLSTETAPLFHSCYLIAATPAVLKAAQADGVAYMRLPRREPVSARRHGRALELLCSPVDVFRPAVEVHDA